ncbi:MAG: triose-phosphate isomerase family protein [Candidatus Taylorbacteria bacterium]
MTKYTIIGNWKMNPDTLDEAKRIILKIKNFSSKLSNARVVLCPPLVFISKLISNKHSSNFNIGAQTVSPEESGPYTGEVSSLMLKDIGVSHVIVGHSEERKTGDTDLIVSRKIKAVIDGGMIPVVCVGELKRDIEGVSHFEELKNQIKNSFADLPQVFVKNIILAYEPVWAIGGSEAMSPEQIYETSLFVRKIFADLFGTESGISVPILYGGSVNYINAADIMRIGKVQGLLVGRESLNTSSFIELLKAVDGLSSNIQSS